MKKGDKLSMMFGQEDFELEINMGREYYQTDARYSITLYRVNSIDSKTHKIYGNSKPSDKKFLPSVQLSVFVNFNNAKADYMAETDIVRQDIDTFNFSVYNKELEEKNIIMNRGDYIKYDHGDRERYYEITSIGFINDISQTMNGRKPYYKPVIAVPVKGDVINILTEI